jgi:hypothetical protein
VAAEVFAIAGDAHLWLGRIGEADYTCETADGRGRSRDECGARLARMVCADTEMLRPADIDAIADRITEAQVQQIARAIRRVLKRLAPEHPGVAVLAGQGTPLARAAAERAGLATCAVADVLGPRAARAAPAAAVAHLLAEAIDPKG